MMEEEEEDYQDTELPTHEALYQSITNAEYQLRSNATRKPIVSPKVANKKRVPAPPIGLPYITGNSHFKSAVASHALPQKSGSNMQITERKVPQMKKTVLPQVQGSPSVYAAQVASAIYQQQQPRLAALSPRSQKRQVKRRNLTIQIVNPVLSSSITREVADTNDAYEIMINEENINVDQQAGGTTTFEKPSNEPLIGSQSQRKSVASVLSPLNFPKTTRKLDDILVTAKAYFKESGKALHDKVTSLMQNRVCSPQPLTQSVRGSSRKERSVKRPQSQLMQQDKQEEEIELLIRDVMTPPNEYLHNNCTFEESFIQEVVSRRHKQRIRTLLSGDNKNNPRREKVTHKNSNIGPTAVVSQRSHTPINLANHQCFSSNNRQTRMKKNHGVRASSRMDNIDQAYNVAISTSTANHKFEKTPMSSKVNSTKINYNNQQMESKNHHSATGASSVPPHHNLWQHQLQMPKFSTSPPSHLVKDYQTVATKSSPGGVRLKQQQSFPNSTFQSTKQPIGALGLGSQSYISQVISAASTIGNGSGQSQFSVLNQKKSSLNTAGQCVVQSGGGGMKAHRSQITKDGGAQRHAPSQLSSIHSSKLKVYATPQTTIDQQQTLQPRDLPGEKKAPAVKEVKYALPGVKIGQGKFGPIELCLYRGELCALKRIPKNSIDKAKRIEHLKNEKKVNQLIRQIGQPPQSQQMAQSGSMQQIQQNIFGQPILMQAPVDYQAVEKAKIKGEFFCKMEETFADQDSINFIFEYCPGQDLFWVMQNEMNLKMSKTQNKDWVKFYAAEILLALEILHQNKIVYRDLKPENVVIDVAGHIKLIDFGFAKRLHSSSQPKHHYRTHTNCGTLGYTAPEVLMNLGASFEADIWSFGILLAELLSGSLPFENKDDPAEINEQIAKCEVKMPRESDQATRDLLQQIFVLEPNLRISIENIKQHKFFSDIDWLLAEKRRLEPVPYKPNPMKYKYLLSNKYDELSSLDALPKKPQSPSHIKGESSISGGVEQKKAEEAKGEVTPTRPAVSQRQDSPTKRNLLGDFTIYRINKEFENF